MRPTTFLGSHITRIRPDVQFFHSVHNVEGAGPSHASVDNDTAILEAYEENGNIAYVRDQLRV